LDQTTAAWLDTAINSLIRREGGFVDHHADRGGATCWGITETVARAHGYQGRMAELPRAVAAAIYRQRYFIAPGFAPIAERAPSLAEELFDTGVNMGPGVAIGFLQRALNALNRGARDYPDIVVDRVIGPATLGALDGYLRTRGKTGEQVLVRALNALQGERYIALAEGRAANESFVFGWLSNRIG